MSELFVNDSGTTLAANVTTGDTSITVASGTGYPGTGNFRIKIDDELMLVTSVTGGTGWAVTRGIEGTSVASHTSGTAVNHFLTAVGLTTGISEGVGSALTTGPWVGYPGLYSQWPTSGWSWPTTSAVFQQGVGVATVNGGLQWTQPANTAAAFSTYVRTQPSVPYKILIGYDFDPYYVNYFTYGVGFWDGTNIKVLGTAYASGLLLRMLEYGPGIFNNTDTAINYPCPRIWTQLENDGSTLTWKYGISPGLLRTIATQSIGTFITPTHIALTGNKNNSTGAADYMCFNSYTQVP